MSSTRAAGKHTQARTHARTHARTQARTRACTHMLAGQTRGRDHQPRGAGPGRDRGACTPPVGAVWACHFSGGSAERAQLPPAHTHAHAQTYTHTHTRAHTCTRTCATTNWWEPLPTVNPTPSGMCSGGASLPQPKSTLLGSLHKLWCPHSHVLVPLPSGMTRGSWQAARVMFVVEVRG